MRSSSPWKAVGALLAVVASNACAAATAGPAQPAPSSQPSPTVAGAPPTRVLPYNEADVHFMTGMISHHAQAIVMSEWSPTHGASPGMQTLARRIIISQTDEINLMQTWLRDHGEPVPEVNPKGMTMTMGGMQHEMLMPGMLTEEQMAELDRARGAEFDRLFLTYMIQHHQGALSMVETLFASHGAGQEETIFKFASDVFGDQSAEIERMQRTLEAMAPAGVGR